MRVFAAAIVGQSETAYANAERGKNMMILTVELINGTDVLIWAFVCKTMGLEDDAVIIHFLKGWRCEEA